MKKLIRNLALPLALSFAASTVFAHKVIGISDGDTLTLLVDDKPLKIRLANIDAPENKQPFAHHSKQSLSDLCFGQNATYKVQDIDRYQRTVAVVTCGGVNVNRAQVERGLAWTYRRYNKDQSLPALQADAKRKRRGLWADDSATPPWEFRRAAWKARAKATDDSDKALCFIGCTARNTAWSMGGGDAAAEAGIAAGGTTRHACAAATPFIASHSAPATS